MESTAPPQTVPVDRLRLYCRPATPAVYSHKQESRAAAQAEEDEEEQFYSHKQENRAAAQAEEDNEDNFCDENLRLIASDG
jgi:hypothetical protein